MELSSLLEPISEDDVCGPDLDEAGDPDFLGFMARVETLLPENYFAFDRATIDFAQEHTAIDRLLARSRDVRLLVIKGKLALLDRKLELFAATLGTIASFLKERWDEINPKAMGEDASFRGAMLASLDDMPQVVMPLQSAPLVNTRRAGWVSFRQHLLSSGKLEPREAEADTDFAPIGQAIRDLNADAKTEAHALVAGCLASVQAINQSFSERPRGISWLRLERLPTILQEMVALLAPDEVLVAASMATSALDGETPAVGALPSGAVRSRADAAAALTAIGAYFAAEEPSSAAWPLVRQSRDLLGKSFFDIVQALMPDKFEQARIKIGRDTGFALPFQMLAGQSESSDAESDNDDHRSDESDTAPDDDGGGPSTAFTARTRGEAVALLAATSAYLRAADPSNPIPLLLDHARSLVGREFIDLMRQMLPASSLDLTEPEN